MRDRSDIEYYRRRAKAESVNAETAKGEVERNLHRELAALYVERADIYERRLDGGVAA